MSKSKHNFQGKECFSRMNFLYQASQLMAGKNNTLSSYYGELCKNIGKKAVLRIDPNIKRDFCKRCSLAQKPGITCDLNIKPQHRKRKSRKMIEKLDQNVQVQISCKLCGQNRNFNVADDYKFWLENPESVAEICTIKIAEKQQSNSVNNKESKNKDAEMSGFKS